MPTAAPDQPDDITDVGYLDISASAGGAAGRGWWDRHAREYQDEHGAFLGDADFCWCPEGVREETAHLLGDLTGRRVLEVGAGAAQCSRWLRSRDVPVVATDVSRAMLEVARELDSRTGIRVPSILADARFLPFADNTFDTVFTAYGAIPFVPDADRVHAEAARVLRPGGRWVFSVTHPVRWAFPDDPTTRGLTANRSYFDRRPYVELAGGRVDYAEYHRTLGDHLRQIVAAGMRVLDIIEPEWPEDNTTVWGGWGPQRGALLPGTTIWICDRP